MIFEYIILGVGIYCVWFLVTSYFSYFVIGFGFYLVWAFFENKFPSKNLPPGPFRLPFLGNLPFLVANRSKPSFITFRNLCKEYGPITYLQIGLQPSIFVDDFDTAKALLNSETWIDRPNDDLMLERTYEKRLGIIFFGGDGWREMRRFSTRTLRDFGFGKQSAMQSMMEDETKHLLEKIEEVESGPDKIVDFKHLFTMPVLNIIWGMISSVRTPEDDEKLKKLIALVDTLTSLTAMGSSILDIYPSLRHVFPGMTGLAYRRKLIRQLQIYFEELLEFRRKEISKEDKRDFIDIFIKEIDRHKELGSEPNHYTDKQFVSTLIDFFEAGSETSSNTLEFAFYYVIKNPRVQRKVQEEIDRVVGRSRFPNTGDRPQMPYTEATLMEVQRMGNVLPMTGRNTTENCTVQGFELEKGATAVVNIYSIHMDKDFWGDPFTFRPERFLNEANQIIAEKSCRVIPFGAGKRVCLGEQMARSTLFSYFTALLQTYTFEDYVTDPGSRKSLENAADQEAVWFEQEVRVGFTLSPNPFQGKVLKRQ